MAIKLNTFIDIITTAPMKDADGFVTTGDTVLASVRAYFEPKNSTEKWANMAAFSAVNALVRFRKIPGVDITPALVIVSDTGRDNIVSAEDVRGRGMYWEVLVEKVDMTKK
jgi:hypothetical protein